MYKDSDFRTVYGHWVSTNLFKTIDGKEEKVVAYLQTLRAYEDRFPLKCWILLYGNIVKDIVIDD